MADCNPVELLPEIWRSHVLSLVRAAQIILERLAEEMIRDGVNISPRAGWILMAIAERPCNQKLVAYCLGINTNQMVTEIDSLESSGLVRRERNPENRREHILVLTDAGRKLHNKMLDGWDRRTRRIFAPIPLPDVHRGSAWARELVKHYYSSR